MDSPDPEPPADGTGHLGRLAERLPCAAAAVLGETIRLNRHAARITGYAPEEIRTLDEWFRLLFPGQAEAVRALHGHDRSLGFPEPRRLPLRHRSGSERLVEIAGFLHDGGEAWLLRDLTEDARAGRLLEQAARAALVGGWEIELPSRRVHWTAECHRLHDTDPSWFEPTVESFVSFFTPQSSLLLREAVERGIGEGQPFDLELEMLSAKGRPACVRVVGAADEQGKRGAKLFGSLQDITARKEADEALRAAAEQRRRLIGASPDCLLELDGGGVVRFANPRAVELLEAGSASEVVGTDWLFWWPLASRPEAESAFLDARWGRESRFQAETASRWWDVRLTPLGGATGRILVAARDMTAIRQAQQERERFQRDLLQTQKLESLGVLAGGIAHDFNNLLAGILGFADLVRATTPPGSPAAGHLAHIVRSSERAADLCRQMLAYAGKGRFVVEALDLGAMVQETAQLLSLGIGKRATLTLSVAPGLPPVQGDASQLRQVVMNLVINASEALGDRDGLIAVSARRERLGEADLAGEAAVGPPPPPGDYVCLEVADTGSGMDEETKSRIFEPFFTTKFTGRGLGLAAVQGIVRGHGGVLRVESEPGRGSRFRACFPPSPVPLPVPPPMRTRPSWRGKGVILVVDDEEPVRLVASELVKSLGFDAIQAQDGEDALKKLRGGASVHLVLLDLTMPRMDGEQALAELRSLAPTLPVVLMSGYSEREVEERFAGQGLAGFVQKPFTRASLRVVLEQALGS
ncbi:MAG: response regulator [Gemmataceae bacterium]|nr:response regulator [Gemmataceae bacterium]